MSWDEYFFGIAKSIQRENSSNACIIVDKNHRPVSIGYEKVERGFILSSIVNAMIFAHQNLDGCILYSVNRPTNQELAYIHQAGIKEIYSSDGFSVNASTIW